MTGDPEGPARQGSAASPRKPSSTLVVDANILLSAVLGRRSRPLFARVTEQFVLVTSIRTEEEVRGVIAHGAGLPAEAQSLATALLADIVIADAAVYADLMVPAAACLAGAPASRNGATSDAHVLACAWTFNADLWSHDRDFAGTGWPAWSNANLAAALADAPYVR